MAKRINNNDYDISLSQSARGDKAVSISLTSLARYGQDFLIILTVVSSVFGPLWYFNVQQPISRLEEKVQRVEDEMSKRQEKITAIDKNVALIVRDIEFIKRGVEKLESNKK